MSILDSRPSTWLRLWLVDATPGSDPGFRPRGTSKYDADATTPGTLAHHLRRWMTHEISVSLLSKYMLSLAIPTNTLSMAMWVSARQAA